MVKLLAALLVLAGTAAALAGPARVTEGIAYGGEARQALDLYVPADVADDAPALVFFYGGGWERGARADLKETAESLADAGMIVVVPDYRLYPQVVFPAFVEDCALAVAEARKLVAAIGGRHRLFVGGHSAGAFNAALLAADEHYLAAAGVPAGSVAGYVLLSGPYDMSGNLPPPYDAVFPAATRAGASVAAFIDGGEPPLLLMTVEADDVVGAGVAERLASAVMVHGGHSVVATYSGSDHLATFRGLSQPASAERADLAAFILAMSAQ